MAEKINEKQELKISLEEIKVENNFPEESSSQSQKPDSEKKEIKLYDPSRFWRNS